MNRGVSENHIIKIDFDERRNKKFLDPDVLDGHIKSLIVDNQKPWITENGIMVISIFDFLLNENSLEQ